MEVAIFKKKQSKSSIKKRPRIQDPDSSESEDDDVVHKQTKSKITGILHKSAQSKIDSALESREHDFVADRTMANRNVNDATREAADIDGRNETTPSSVKSGNHDLVDRSADSNLPMKLSSRKGPMKAPGNVRAISVIDYQPDVCKDYRQTGFCGFGDTCKFLHDRGDFKQGWQLDRDWEAVGKGKKDNKETKKSMDTELDLSEIPFKCVICKNDYKDPIITKCGHYFCEGCAIERYKKTASCAQCGHGTGGLFSGAKKLKELLHARSFTQDPSLPE